MSGHSKWATIKRSKGKTDAARGKLFSRLIKEITVAAKMGGGDVDANPRLRSAVATAKSNNMPSKNIDNAIAKGTGQLEGVSYEEVTFEGYGPFGVAILIDCLTDNRNRVVAEVRHALTKAGGNLGASNSVAWMFTTTGLIRVSREAGDEDKLMEIVLEAGAEDLQVVDDTYEITTALESFDAVKTALEAAGITIMSAELTKIAKNTVKVEGESVAKVLRVLETLDDLDDTQNVYSNADMSDEDIEKASAE
jgi:YebC/PmpR family DNA-binding regulatory protein